MIIINDILAIIFSLTLGSVIAHIKPDILAYKIIFLLIIIEIVLILNSSVVQQFLFGRVF
jgi:hypothetical protein